MIVALNLDSGTDNMYVDIFPSFCQFNRLVEHKSGYIAVNNDKYLILGLRNRLLTTIATSL